MMVSKYLVYDFVSWLLSGVSKVTWHFNVQGSRSWSDLSCQKVEWKRHDMKGTHYHPPPKTDGEDPRYPRSSHHFNGSRQGTVVFYWKTKCEYSSKFFWSSKFFFKPWYNHHELTIWGICYLFHLFHPSPISIKWRRSLRLVVRSLRFSVILKTWHR